MEEIIIKNISSLEKHFSNERVEDIAEYCRASALGGERFSYQIAYTCRDIRGDVKKILYHRVRSDAPAKITVSRVDCVPVRMPMYKVDADDYYISREPGLYPDLLVPVTEKTQLFAFKDEYMCLRVDVEIPLGAKAGAYPIEFSLIDDGGNEAAKTVFELEIVGADLPEQEIKVTEWFHADCLASYYRVPVFSKEHWRIIELTVFINSPQIIIMCAYFYYILPSFIRRIYWVIIFAAYFIKSSYDCSIF